MYSQIRYQCFAHVGLRHARAFWTQDCSRRPSIETLQAALAEAFEQINIPRGWDMKTSGGDSQQSDQSMDCAVQISFPCVQFFIVATDAA
jgi:hypothetical protein